MRTSLPFFALSAALLASLSPAFSADQVLARIGNRDVKAADIRPAIDALEPLERAAIASDPAALNQFVRSLILQRMLFNQAVADGYDKRPSVQERIERARQLAIADGYLSSSTRAPESYPPEADISRFYDENKASLTLPAQYRLAQIFIASPEGASELEAITAQRKAKDIRSRLDAPNADFASLAREESEEPQSAAKGGDIGLLPANLVQPEVMAKVERLEPGRITDPIRLPGGWHIVKLIEMQPPRPATLDEVRPQIIERLRANREAANREEFLSRLLRDNPVVINEIAVSELLEPAKTP